LTSIGAKKEQLDALRPLSPEALAGLEHYYDIELTYTSNAIEGNTLSAVETTLVIEQGVTIGGKPLKDHLEALDHYDAIRWVRKLARETEPLRSRLIADWWPFIHSTTVRTHRTAPDEPDPDTRRLSSDCRAPGGSGGLPHSRNT
jgi:Fic family protein